MRQKIFCLAAFMFGLLAPWTYAEETPAAPAATAASGAHHGSLYRISRQGNTAWLFGTIHVGTVSVDPMEGGLADKLTSADKLAVEVNIDSMDAQGAIVRYALYPSGDSIDKHLSEKAQATLRKALDRAGIPWEVVARMKPWFVTNLLMLKELENEGYSAARGTEMYLIRSAKSANKPILEVESADTQLALFNRMTAAQQEIYLTENLAELESGEAMRKTRDLYNAWATSDDTVMATLLQEMMDDKGFTAQFTKREILEKRNPVMAKKIASLVKANKNIFVAIGSLHLLGKQGVPEQLKRMGFEVTKIH